MKIDLTKSLIKYAIDQYLERSQRYEDVNLKINAFISNCLDLIYEIFVYPFTIDITILNDISGPVTDVLAKEPKLFQEAVTDFFFDKVQFAADQIAYIQFAQIETPVVLVCFPFLPVHLSNALMQLRGYLMEYSILQRQLRSSAWKCEEPCCLSNPMLIVKASNKCSILCENCAAPMIEIMEGRSYKFVYYVTLSIKPFNFKNRSAITTVEGFIEAERCENICLELGSEYIVTGTYSREMFNIWGIYEITQTFSSVSLSNPLEVVRTALCQSPWAFTYWLSNKIGEKIVPTNTFRHMRLGLLLSLASVKTDKSISMLILSKNAHIIQQLIWDASSLISKFIPPSATIGLGGRFSKNRVQAGSLLLAKNGVCYLGDWTTYNDKELSIIQEFVESNKIVLEGKYGFSIGSNTAVWTLSDNNINHKHKKQLQTLQKTFGLLWKPENYENIEDVSVNFVLNQRSEFSLNVTDDHLKAYVEMIQGINVKLSDDCQQLLKKYFVCSRRIRGDALPITALEQLTALAESHARINQRATAISEDVLVALELCEHCLGPSQCFKPPPKNIQSFRVWLEENLFTVSLTSQK